MKPLRRKAGLARPVAGLRQRLLARRADEQLPELILSLTGALRAGLSLTQALAVATADTPAPLGPELRRCLDEAELGIPWSEVLEGLRRRLPGEGLTLLVWALSVHRRTGGDLPALCDRLHELLRERRRLDAKLAAATAQSRLSAGVVLVVPFLLAVSLYRLAPDYLTPLLRRPAGWALMTWAGLMNGLGLMLIFRLCAPRW